MAAEEDGGGLRLEAKVSAVLSSIKLERDASYSRSCVGMATHVENKYPLADIIMESCEGERVSGNLEGHGSAKFNNGCTYEGEFRNGVMHGRGRYSWPDGVAYEGEFTSCHITGSGVYYWPDGSAYVGEVLNGVRHGYGTYRCLASGVTYTGQWVAGRRQGKGRLQYDSAGEVYYEGQWEDNQRQGHGTRQYQSGNIYEGEWQCNRRHGYGVMHWLDRGERYEGQWVGGAQHGRGCHSWLLHAPTDHAQYPLCNRYDGEWRHGLREGRGTFYYASGAVYEGEWRANKKEGRGRFTFHNGDVYEGLFHDDQMAGAAAVGGGAGESHVTAMGVAEAQRREGGSFSRPETPLGRLIGDGGGQYSEQLGVAVGHLTGGGGVSQLHCVLLRHLSQLKKIYHHYSSLGWPAGEPSSSSSSSSQQQQQQQLSRLQLWRLLRDCNIHHLTPSIFDTDPVTTATATTSQGGSDSEEPVAACHQPWRPFLMRDFLQALTLLSHHLYHHSSGGTETVSGGVLASCLSRLVAEQLLPHACHVRGLLYQSPTHYQACQPHLQHCWRLYQALAAAAAARDTGSVTLRQVLLLLKDCGLVCSRRLSAAQAVAVLVGDSPQPSGDYNLETKVTFLEFFESLLECAVVWYRSEPASPAPPAALQETPCLEKEGPPSVAVSPASVAGGGEEGSGEGVEVGSGEGGEVGRGSVAGPLQTTQQPQQLTNTGGGVVPLDEWAVLLHAFFTENILPNTTHMLLTP